MTTLGVSRLKNARLSIAVTGDVMLDEFHWCQVSRISPEAPVPICRVERTELIPGGAANVANNIKSLGGLPFLFGVVGEDSSGDKLIKVLSDKGISVDNIVKDYERPTTLKSRVIAHQQQVVRVDRESSCSLSSAIESKLVYQMKMFKAPVSGVVISDYNKGTLSSTILKEWIAYGKDKGIPVVVDPKGDDYERYKGASVLTPNFGEFQVACHEKIVDEEQLFSCAKVMIRSLDLQGIVITRSEKGATIVTSDGVRTDIPTRAREIYDITGAGDTVISVLVLALSAGYSLEEATRLANEAAGIVVAKLGTATVSLSELEDVLSL